MLCAQSNCGRENLMLHTLARHLDNLIDSKFIVLSMVLQMPYLGILPITSHSSRKDPNSHRDKLFPGGYLSAYVSYFAVVSRTCQGLC